MDQLSEGIKIINDNNFGNGCCIFTSDGHNARIFAEKAEIGMVGINIPLQSHLPTIALEGGKIYFWRS